MNNMHAHIICISTRIPSSPCYFLIFFWFTNQGKGFDSTKQLLLLLESTYSRVVVCILASTSMQSKKDCCAHSRVHQMTGKFSLFLPTVLYRYVTCPESTTLHHQSSNKPQPWVPFSGMVRVAWPIYLAYELYTLCDLSMRTTS